MTFEHPVFLLLGAGLVLLVLLSLRSHARRRRHLATFLGGRRAVHRLSGSDLYRLPLERMVFLGVGALAMAAAAAEPRQPTAATPPPRPVRSVVLAIDVSASMQAADVTPTRLARAVRVAGDLIETLDGDRVGLLLFAGASYPLAPPTYDHQALTYLLRGVVPTLASVYDPGTLLSVGIREAAALLDGESGPGKRAIILIGDGEAGEPDATVAAATQAAAVQGIAVHTIGVGTAPGAGMVLPDGQYRRGGPVVDASGRPVTSRLREPRLRRIAQMGGGTYAPAADRARLRDVHGWFETVAAEPIPEAPPPPRWWDRYDLATRLALAALIGLLLESLLDVRLPRPMVAARRAT